MYKTLLVILFSLFLGTAYGQRATDTFRLYFNLNKDALTSTAEKKIDLLIYNDKIISGSSVMIIGYADYLGTEGYNKDLSMRRAQNIKDYLVKYGINSNDIKLCVGQGEVTRNVAATKDGFPTDRRVDIVVNNRTRKDPLASGGKGKKDTVHKKDMIRRVAINNMDDMTKLKPGSTFQLNNVYFSSDRHVIKPESFPILEKLYDVLKANPNLTISIEGHVCCIQGTPDALDIDTYEPILSVNRAREIYNYLVQKGIEPARLRYVGYGKRFPIVANEQTEEDADKNRRVEIRITGNGK